MAGGISGGAMARPMRIVYPGAVYHVTARGNRRCDIFTEDEDGQSFLVILGEVSRRFNLLCHAYCLMGNHYHLILETPDGNLPRAMRQLNGVYTQTFNKRHCKCGHVFQGRYKAILIEKAAYLLEACRYVVLNPVRAGLVAGPADWRWSSYRSMVGLEPPPDFLATEWVLRQFSDDPGRARDVYAGFVKDGAGEKIWEDLLGGMVLGSEAFAQERAAYGQIGVDFGEIPRQQRLLGRPTLAKILSAPGDRGGKWLKAVDAYGYAQKEVAQHEGMHYSYVSRVLRRERSKVKT